MKAPKNIRKLRDKFLSLAGAELAFVQSFNQLRRQAGFRSYPLKASIQAKLCEMSFISLFVAWEDFLESTFEHYVVLGDKCRPKLRLKVQVNDFETARELMRGDRKFAEWADPEKVRIRAKMFLANGEPFESTLTAALRHLKRMQTVRNRIVHHSEYAAKRFDSLLRELYGHGRNVSPGEFLLNTPPISAMPIGSSTAFPSMFELFISLLSATAAKIVK